MKRVAVVFSLIVLASTTLFAQQMSLDKRKAIVREQFLRSFHEKTGTTPDKMKDARVFRLPAADTKSEKPTPQGGFEQAVSKSVNAESELHAAINVKDTTNIVVGAMSYVSGGGLGFPIYYTKDLGKTWRKSTFTDQPVSGAYRFGGGDPMFTYNLDGSVAYVTWIDVSIQGFTFDTLYANIYFATSTNGGQNWKSSPTQTLASELLINDGVTDAGSFPDKQWLTCDRSNSLYRGTIYGSFLLFTEDAISLNVASIPPSGSTFADPVKVELGPIVAMQIATLDVDAAGRLHITFHGTEDADIYHIYHVVSDDGGASFSMPKRISRAEIASHSGSSIEYVIPGFGERQVPSVQVACGKGSGHENEVYCVWDGLGVEEDHGDGSDIYFARSTDGGATWSAPTVVNKDVAEVPHEQYRVTMTVNERGIICIGWYDGRESSDNTSVDYYTAFSFDGGKTFVAEQSVTTKAMDFTTVGLRNGEFGVGEYMQIVATPYLAIPIWSDARKGNGDLDIYAALVPIASEVLGVKSISNIDAGLTLESVYPNPANDHLSVSLSLTHDEAVTVSLIDMLGSAQAVKTYKLSAGANTVEHSFNVPAGSYILRLTTKEGSVSRGVQIVK